MMKKAILLVFIILIIYTTIFVYESIRNPVIRVILPERHDLSHDDPVLLDDIIIGRVKSIHAETIKENENTLEKDIAKVRLKGDIFHLLYEEDTFSIGDGKIIVEKGSNRANPITRSTTIKSMLYKSIYQNISVFIDPLRSKSHEFFDNSIERIMIIMEEKKDDHNIQIILENTRSRLQEYSGTAKDELTNKKEEILSYIDQQIDELKDKKAQEAVETLEELKEQLRESLK